MGNQTNTFEIWAALVVFVLFVLPTVVFAAYNVLRLTWRLFLGEEEKRRQMPPNSDKIDEIVDRFWKVQEFDAKYHGRVVPKRPGTWDEILEDRFGRGKKEAE